MDENASYSNDLPKSDLVSVESALSSSEDRMSQHRVMPQAVGQTRLGDVISGYPASTNLGTAISSGFTTIPNSTSVSFTFGYQDPQKRVILAVPDVSIYNDTLAPANEWPNATYGLGNMPIVIYNNWGQSNNVNIVTKVVVRNNTGSSRSVAVLLRWRLLVNSSPVLSGQTAVEVSP